MSMGIIILGEMPGAPLLTHSTRLLGGSAEKRVMPLVAGALKMALTAAVCVKVIFGQPQLRREMKKRLFTTFLSVAGPQDPLKPELGSQALPVPCSPSSATTSVSVRVGIPVFIVSSISSQPPAPLGKLASVGPVLDAAGALRPAKKVTPLQLIVAPPFLMPQPRALSSQSTQKSALLSLLKIWQFVLLGLVAVLQAWVSTCTKLSRPRLSVLAMLMEPSQPPMQSWKAARMNFLISILKSGEDEKKQPSMVCSIESISAPVKLVWVWTTLRQEARAIVIRKRRMDLTTIFILNQFSNRDGFHTLKWICVMNQKQSILRFYLDCVNANGPGFLIT